MASSLLAMRQILRTCSFQASKFGYHPEKDPNLLKTAWICAFFCGIYSYAQSATFPVRLERVC